MSKIIWLLREIIREAVLLPLPLKICLAVSISVIFIAITQWEHIGLDAQWARLTHSLATVANSPAPIARKQSKPAPIISVPLPLTSVDRPSGVEAAPLRRRYPFVIKNPEVRPNGTIVGSGHTLYLYGIKPFDRNKICMRASGPWACGLRAYAELRNAIAEKTIVCEPTKVLQNTISANCRIGEIDLSMMLIRNGLAELDEQTETSELAQAQANAKSQKIGIWRQ